MFVIQMMKVQRNNTINKLIDDLDKYYKHKSVETIQQTLKSLRDGQEKTEDQVNDIFKPVEGDWAEPKPGRNDPKHGVKGICAMIKVKMFKKI